MQPALCRYNKIVLGSPMIMLMIIFFIRPTATPPTHLLNGKTSKDSSCRDTRWVKKRWFWSDHGGDELGRRQCWGSTMDFLLPWSVFGKFYIFYQPAQVPYYKDVLSPTLPANGLYFVDHVVGNQPDLTMEDAAKWLVVSLFFLLLLLLLLLLLF